MLLAVVIAAIMIETSSTFVRCHDGARVADPVLTFFLVMEVEESINDQKVVWTGRRALVAGAKGTSAGHLCRRRTQHED